MELTIQLSRHRKSHYKRFEGKVQGATGANGAFPRLWLILIFGFFLPFKLGEKVRVQARVIDGMHAYISSRKNIIQSNN